MTGQEVAMTGQEVAVTGQEVAMTGQEVAVTGQGIVSGFRPSHSEMVRISLRSVMATPCPVIARYEAIQAQAAD
jgi:hypothetical protein